MTAGRFGNFGGRYVPETLIGPLIELENAYEKARKDSVFLEQYSQELKTFVGRATPLHYADNLSQKFKINLFLKREDLAYTGSHKINNSLGQVLLARYMGKSRIIAETGAGQHGVATAAAAAKFGLKCVIYMGSEDMRCQSFNVEKMKILGATVHSVEAGTKTLKEAVAEAMRDWAKNFQETSYILGSALGPHPYPTMVRDFQAIIGREAREQILSLTGSLPQEIIACVGGGSNAIGIFSAFLQDKEVKLFGIEAGGKEGKLGGHASRFQGGRRGVFQGTETFVLQDMEGQILQTHSIAAGLDYAAIGPEHAYLKQIGRVHYDFVTNQEAIEALKIVAKEEGIIPALESSHAFAFTFKRARKRENTKEKALPVVLLNLSGRGDKDIELLKGYEANEI